MDDRVFRVRADSNVNNVASKIAHTFYGGPKDTIDVRAMGAGSVNQAVKAIAVARGLVATRGYDLVNRVGFDKVEADSGDIISVMVFRLSLQ